MVNQTNLFRNKTYYEMLDQEGSKNRNWKGGISQDRTRYKQIETERYPDRVKARDKLRYEVSRGRIIRPTICQRCGGGGLIHAHHHDYSKPFDVEWICKDCHRSIHPTPYPKKSGRDGCVKDSDVSQRRKRESNSLVPGGQPERVGHSATTLSSAQTKKKVSENG